MAVGASFPSAQLNEQELRAAQGLFLKIHEGLALFNEELDAYKKKPSIESSATIRSQFDKIKSTLSTLKSDSASQNYAFSCKIIEILMERTEKRMTKLLKKYAQNSPTQQNAASFGQKNLENLS